MPARDTDRRIDGLEAVAGELRARIDRLEQAVRALHHNQNNHTAALRVLNEQLVDVAREAGAAIAAVAELGER